MTAAQMDSLQANDYNWTVSTKTASYVLVATDKGTRVVMNAAGATTITVNTSLFSAGDTLFIQNIGAGTCTITAGTATVTTAGSLALSTWAGGTLYFTSASAAIFFSGSAPAYGTATGGIGAPTAVTISSVNYQYLQFNSTGTLTVTKAGFFDFLAIGGGAGSLYRSDSSRASGGGGAGCVICGTVYLSANQTITIGAGGATTDTGSRTTGNATTIGAGSPFVIIAGGAINRDGGIGQGSGNGRGGGNPVNDTFTTATTTGYNGGGSHDSTAGGGGGGFTGAGVTSSVAGTGATGGTGFDMATFIGGTPTPSHRATGGGGGGQSTAGGQGGNSNASSNAGSTNTSPSSAAANSGSGGGGGVGTTQSSGNGGSGVCFIRWKV